MYYLQVSGILNDEVPDDRFFAAANQPLSLYHNPSTTPNFNVNSIRFGTHVNYVNGCQAELKDHFYNNVLGSILPQGWEKIEIPELYLAKIAHMVLITSETANETHILEEEGSDLSPTTLIMFAVCSRVTFPQYMKASAQKTRMMRFFSTIFEKVDVIVTPTNACLPKEIHPNSLSYGELDEANLLKTMWFVYLANLCGLPALTLNMGYSPSGLPMGLMLMVPWWQEDKLFAIASYLEEKLPKLKKPNTFYGF